VLNSESLSTNSIDSLLITTRTFILAKDARELENLDLRVAISMKPKIERINVVGTSGSGKSTFCKKLAKILHYPYIEMDKFFWEPKWKQASSEDFLLKLSKDLLQDRWVLDGNYTDSIPVKWKNVEMVIWLDYSFSLTLFRAFKRAIARVCSQKEIWEGTGNIESFYKTFCSKDSIILFTIKTHAYNRNRYLNYMKDARFAHIKFVQLKNHSEAEKFLLEAARHINALGN
jgi:adenylate kinase family enzyme